MLLEEEEGEVRACLDSHEGLDVLYLSPYLVYLAFLHEVAELELGQDLCSILVSQSARWNAGKKLLPSLYLTKATSRLLIVSLSFTSPATTLVYIMRK